MSDDLDMAETWRSRQRIREGLVRLEEMYERDPRLRHVTISVARGAGHPGDPDRG